MKTKYGEAKVDSMRTQKDEELVRYRKEQEQQKRFETSKKQKLAGRKLVIKKGGLKKKGLGKTPIKTQDIMKKQPAQQDPFTSDMPKVANMPDPNFGARP